MSATTGCQVLFDLFPSSRGRVALGRVTFAGQAPRIAILREISELARGAVGRAVGSSSAHAHPRLLKTWGIVQERDRSFVATEYMPAFCLAELLSVGRARQRGIPQGAAVRIAIQSLQLIDVARAALPGKPSRYLYADCLWVADFGEVLLAEPGLAGALAGGGADTASAEDAESQDVTSVAMALFQLATGRLLTGDIAAAVKRELSVPLARVVEAALTGSELLSTSEGLQAALSSLPPVLVGDDASVTAAVTELAGDLIQERKAKLLALTRSSARTEDEGVTRVYSSDSQSEPDFEEATVPLKHQHLTGLSRRVVRAAPELEARAAPSPARRVATVPTASRQVKARVARFSWTKLERALLYVLGVLVVIVVILSVARPERWRATFQQVRALR